MSINQTNRDIKTQMETTNLEVMSNILRFTKARTCRLH